MLLEESIHRIHRAGQIGLTPTMFGPDQEFDPARRVSLGQSASHGERFARSDQRIFRPLKRSIAASPSLT